MVHGYKRSSKYVDSASSLLLEYSTMSYQKLILVIGATGAQGIAVIDALLAPAKDGKQSPFAIRALSRDPESKRAKELTARGIEVVKGE